VNTLVSGLRAIISRPRELLDRGTVGEDLDGHPFDFAKDHFACIGVELVREGYACQLIMLMWEILFRYTISLPLTAR